MKTIKIDNFDYEVIEEGNGENVYITDRECVYGYCDYPNQKIYIHKDLGKDLFKFTLIHEITHAYLFARGLDHKLDVEDICNFMASVACEVAGIAENWKRNNSQGQN